MHSRLFPAPTGATYGWPSKVTSLGGNPGRPRRSPLQPTRYASTLASSTAINATKHIPGKVRGLYNALSTLKSQAANYVNLSRVLLALRSLETEDAIVRVAVFAQDDDAAVGKLVRVLLADPLSPEASWERTLEEGQQANNGGLLLRYGETAEINRQSSALTTMLVPSPLLHAHNMEILLTRIPLDASISESSIDAVDQHDRLLVPSTNVSQCRGDFPALRYPVHKAMVLGDGLQGCAKLARYVTGISDGVETRSMIKSVVALSAPASGAQSFATPTITAVDIQEATAAISEFRQSLRNATIYEQDWFHSGMPALMEWLVDGTKPTPAGIKPAVSDLIESLLDDTVNQVTRQDSETLQTMVSSAIPESTRQMLNQKLELWAERAHSELRDDLDLAFGRPRWARLAWWKLFWRVDDVETVAMEVLERRWLVESEKEMIWLAGRMQEAGLLNDIEGSITDHQPSPTTSSAARPSIGTPPPPPFLTDLIPRNPTPDEHPAIPLLSRESWPMHIPLARRHLVTTTIPPFHALAQTLLLQTLSTSVLTSAASALVFASSYSTSVFEAGAIAALGLVWSLRRLQTKWLAARRFWEAEIREAGRAALKDTQDLLAALVRDGGRVRVDRDAEEERRVAREAVERVREELERVKAGGGEG
ncbi:MAG: hypothetical protein M1833_001797 [Piccolia ochrophora]|nr:MAG: hypothetical protein M1833_001797 [Piccolia ochrophora]